MGRHIDTRVYRDRLSLARGEALRAIAEAVSEKLAGEHRITILEFSGRTGNPSAIASTGARAADGTWLSHAAAHVREIAPALGLGDTQVPEFRAAEPVAETSGGARAVHLAQLHKDIPIFQAALTVRYDEAGNLLDTVGQAFSVKGDLAAAPILSVEEATFKAAQHLAAPPPDEATGGPDRRRAFDLAELTSMARGEPKGSDRSTRLDAGSLGGSIEAGLVWFDRDDDLVLAWEVDILLPRRGSHDLVLVDAQSGEILYGCSLVSAVAAQGNVYHSANGARVMTSFPRPLSSYPFPADATLPANFPDDWVAGVATTGNAVVAGVVINKTLVAIDGTQQNGVLTFNPLDNTVDLGVVNLFYYCCMMHDAFYLLGFREINGNFQTNNFDRLGWPNDPVTAEYYPGAFPEEFHYPEGAFLSGQQRGDGNGANLYASLLAETGRHCALDSTVIQHEYMHGVTARLVGGPTTANTLVEPQSLAMAEGWSDFVACVFNITDVIGAWVRNNPRGMRTAPYDSNYPGHFGMLGVGVYANVTKAQGGQGVYPAGEVWCATLMEMYRGFFVSPAISGPALSGQYFALQLLVDALKLTPPNPNFLQGRDALFSALTLMKGISPDAQNAAYQAMRWAFNKFGMGDGSIALDTGFAHVLPSYATLSMGHSKCQKCSALVTYLQGYSPAPPYSCQAGGTHRIAAAPGYERSDDWRRMGGDWSTCRKCAGLVFKSQLAQARCPAGDFHVAYADSEVVTKAPAAGERDWWRCTKCQGLYPGAAFTNDCPNGGQHAKDATTEYALIPHAVEPARQILGVLPVNADEWSVLAIDTCGFLITISSKGVVSTEGQKGWRPPGWRSMLVLERGSDGRRAFFPDAVDGYGYYSWKKDDQGQGFWSWSSLGLCPGGFRRLVGMTDDGSIITVIGDDGQLWWGSTPPFNPGLWTWLKITPNAGPSPTAPILAATGMRVQMDHGNIVGFEVMFVTQDGHAGRAQMDPLPQQWPFTRTWTYSDLGATVALTNAQGVSAPSMRAVFASSIYGVVWRGAWDEAGKAWSWKGLDRQPPPGPNTYILAPADDGTGVAVAGSDGHLWLWRDGPGWTDLGSPPGANPISRSVGLFAKGWKCLVVDTGHQLYLAELSGAGGHWTVLGTPGNWMTLPSPDKWQVMPGSARDIGVGADGSIWVVGTRHIGDQPYLDFSIYSWNSTRNDWDLAAGGGEAISVMPDGTAWTIGSSYRIETRSAQMQYADVTPPPGGPSYYQPLPHADIGIGANGTVWASCTRKAAGGFAVYRWNAVSKAWDDMGANAVRIAADQNGNAWTVDDQGRIARWTGELWLEMPGLAKDVAVGKDGSVWMVAASGQAIAKWTGDRWVGMPVDGADRIAVGPTGLPFVVTKQLQILRRLA